MFLSKFIDMPVEIERKFLVHQEIWNHENPQEHKQIRQGYLLSQPDKTIRVRIAGEKGYITIKGKAHRLGRPEYEYEIPGRRSAANCRI